MKAVLVGIAAAVLLVACDAPSQGPSARRQSPVPMLSIGGGTVDTARRPATQPDRVRVINNALSASVARVRQAIADLRAVGYWDDLTDHLYVVKIATRPGLTGVPDDGHLADALLTAQIDDLGSGAACDIMFFPRAVAVDLERWATYHAQGAVPDEAPTLRQYWAAVLGHELGHCLDWEGKEPFAERWEAKVLEAVRSAGLE